MVSHPTCCCSASLDRYDLQVGLEGFRLMSVARTPDALVLDVQSCNQLVECPGCGVIAQGHGRVVVEVIDAPWAGVPVRIRWHKRRWICRETTCQIATFIDQNHSVCAPGASGDAGDPLGDWSTALRGSHYLGAGPPVRNHVEYRVVPYQAVPASRI